MNGNPEARRRVASVARASSRSSSSSTGSSGTTSSRRSSAGREKEREIKMQLRIYLARNSAFWKDKIESRNSGANLEGSWLENR